MWMRWIEFILSSTCNSPEIFYFTKVPFWWKGDRIVFGDSIRKNPGKLTWAERNKEHHSRGFIGHKELLLLKKNQNAKQLELIKSRFNTYLHVFPLIYQPLPPPSSVLHSGSTCFPNGANGSFRVYFLGQENDNKLFVAGKELIQNYCDYRQSSLTDHNWDC